MREALLLLLLRPTPSYDAMLVERMDDAR